MAAPAGIISGLVTGDHLATLAAQAAKITAQAALSKIAGYIYELASPSVLDNEDYAAHQRHCSMLSNKPFNGFASRALGAHR